MYSMIISNRLRRLLIVSIFCLPALGLSGCGSYNKARLGAQSGTESMGESQTQAEQADSRSKKFIDWTGYIGGKAGYLSGGILGGMAGACFDGVYVLLDGVYVLFTGNNIGPVPSYVNTYELASYGSKFFGTFGNYACTRVATALVWVKPYLITSAEWIGSKSYDGVKWASSSIYDYSTQAADTPNNHTDNPEPNIATYEVHIGDDSEPFTVLEDKDHDSDYESGDESGDDVYFDAKA